MERETNKVDNYIDDKILQIHRQKLAEKRALEAEKAAKKQKNKKKRKGFIIGGISAALAAVILVAGFLGFKKKNNTNAPVKPSTVTVDDLGLEEELTTNQKSEYGETTGNIKKEDLVEKDGVIYKDQEAADKSDEVGNTSIDLQDGTLEIDKDGDVVVKDEVDYEIIDPEGNVIGSGTTSKDEIPDGYVEDENIDGVVKEEDAGKYVTLEHDYYDKEGNLIFSKGDVVTKEAYEKIINDSNLTTTKPETNKTSSTTSTMSSAPTTSSTTSSTESTVVKEEVVVNQGVVNQDGTYTIDGVTFMDKATWETIVLGEYNEEDLRYNENGVIYIAENINTKTR